MLEASVARRCITPSRDESTLLFWEVATSAHVTFEPTAREHVCTQGSIGSPAEQDIFCAFSHNEFRVAIVDTKEIPVSDKSKAENIPVL